MRGIDVESKNCRLCSLKKETVHHWLSGCTVIAGSEYLQRHNKVLMVFAVEWTKKEALLEKNAVWYKMAWKKGTVLEKEAYLVSYEKDHFRQKA